VGKITSGVPSPSLKKNIAMAYIQTHCSKLGTEVMVETRNKLSKGVISRMPFVPSNYYLKK